LEYDEEKYWMLLERLHPGVMIFTLKDDEEANHIGAEVMKKIWKTLDSPSLLASQREQVNIHQQADGLQRFILLSDRFDPSYPRGGVSRVTWAGNMHWNAPYCLLDFK